MNINYLQTCIDINHKDVEFNQYDLDELKQHSSFNIRYNWDDDKIYICVYLGSPLEMDINKSSKTIINYNNKLFSHYRTYYIENKAVFVFFCNQNLYFENGVWKIREYKKTLSTL